MVAYLEKQVALDTAIAYRNAAMVSVGFFGVRRGAEVVAFKMTDITEADKLGVRLVVRCQKNDKLGLGQLCLIPHVAALQKCSPLHIFNTWLQHRSSFCSSPSEGYTFVNVTGQNRGGPVSTDSLRKHVTASFGNSTATHSLRKGGATFYARQGAAEDATRQQGGWRTTEIMRAVYTKLTRKEVDIELRKVLDASSLRLTLRQSFRALGASTADVLAQPAARLRPFLAFVAGHLTDFNESLIQESRVIGMVKILAQHQDEHTRNHAISLYTSLRSTWMAIQSAKRPRLSED